MGPQEYLESNDARLYLNEHGMNLAGAIEFRQFRAEHHLQAYLNTATNTKAYRKSDLDAILSQYVKSGNQEK